MIDPQTAIIILVIAFALVLGLVSIVCYLGGKEEGRKEERRRAKGVD